LLGPTKSQTLELGLAKRTKIAAFIGYFVSYGTHTQEFSMLLKHQRNVHRRCRFLVKVSLRLLILRVVSKTLQGAESPSAKSAVGVTEAIPFSFTHRSADWLSPALPADR
jgi:hypothetical protein